MCIRDSQCIVHKSGVKVDVRRQYDVQTRLFGEDLRASRFDEIVEHEFIHQSLLFRQLAGHFFQELGPRIAESVDRMAETVDQAGAVVCLSTCLLYTSRCV